MSECRGANCERDEEYTIYFEYTDSESDLCKTCAIDALNLVAGTEAVDDDPREDD